MNNLTLYERALIFAIKAHGDQKRKYTGEPYTVHPIRVAALVREAGASTAQIAAAILHDVLEDTSATHGQLVDEFGEYVARLVYQVSDIGRAMHGTRKMRKDFELQHLADASPEAHTIKVCDIIDNAESIQVHDPEFAKVYLPEKRAQLKVLSGAGEILLNRARQICEETVATIGPMVSEKERSDSEN